MTDQSPWTKRQVCCDTLQGTNTPPPKKNGILKMIFLFPRWDMLIPWRVLVIICRFLCVANERHFSHFYAELCKKISLEYSHHPTMTFFYLHLTRNSHFQPPIFLGLAMLEVAMSFLRMMPSQPGWMRSWQPRGLSEIFDLRIQRKRQATRRQWPFWAGLWHQVS